MCKTIIIYFVILIIVYLILVNKRYIFSISVNVDTQLKLLMKVSYTKTDSAIVM